MAKQASALRYAVQFHVVFKYFGQLCLVLAALTLVPLVMSESIRLLHGAGGWIFVPAVDEPMAQEKPGSTDEL